MKKKTCMLYDTLIAFKVTAVSNSGVLHIRLSTGSYFYIYLAKRLYPKMKPAIALNHE